MALTKDPLEATPVIVYKGRESRVKKFLRPTRITWITFVLLASANMSVPFVGWWIKLLSGWRWDALDFLIVAPLYQLLGLVYLAEDYLEVDVAVGGDLIAIPQGFGWLLVAMAVLVTLAVHYTVASCVSWYYDREKA